MSFSSSDPVLPSDLDKVPLRALGISTRQLMGQFLNPGGILFAVKTDDGFDLIISNNIEGLAELAGFSPQQIINMKLQSDPTIDFIQQWCTRGATVGELWKCLTVIERPDVQETCRQNIINDCRVYMQAQERQCQIPSLVTATPSSTTTATVVTRPPTTTTQLSTQSPPQLSQPRAHPSPLSPSSLSSSSRTPVASTGNGGTGAGDKSEDENIHRDERTESMDSEFELITYDDIRLGHNRTRYDAFISYSDDSEADRAFVRQIIQVMENERGLKLFVPGRDDIPGAAEHAMTAYIIEKRCTHCVVVLSNDFLQSPVCNFHLRFSQALSPDAKDRRIVPVKRHDSVKVPSFLNFVTCCDFTKSDMPDWVWNRLHIAITRNNGRPLALSTKSFEDSLKEIPFPIQRRFEE